MSSDVGKVLFLTRDRGSAQTLLPVIKLLQGCNAVRSCVLVPTVSAGLLAEQGVDFMLLNEGYFAQAPEACISTILDQMDPDLVVSGSSPGRGQLPESPEQYLILAARRRGIPSLAILDFWGMYGERFLSPGGRVDPALMPDRLCVLDSRCRDDLIALGASSEQIAVTHNPWLDAVVGLAAAPPAPSTVLVGYDLRLLFVSQPYAETRAVRGWQFSQTDLLRHLLDALPPAHPGKRHLVLIWSHPAETLDQWRGFDLHARGDVVVQWEEEKGAEILAHVDLVVSGHSTVTYEALHLGTPSVSYRPGKAVVSPQMVEELGLVPMFDNANDLRQFLAEYDPGKMRARLRQAKHWHVQAGRFFSDGQATRRVVAEMGKMLPGVGSCLK